MSSRSGCISFSAAFSFETIILDSSSRKGRVVVPFMSSELSAPWGGVSGRGKSGLLMSIFGSWGLVSKNSLWSGAPTFSACFFPTAIAHPVCIRRIFGFAIPLRKPNALLWDSSGIWTYIPSSISPVRGSSSKCFSCLGMNVCNTWYLQRRESFVDSFLLNNALDFWSKDAECKKERNKLKIG